MLCVLNEFILCNQTLRIVHQRQTSSGLWPMIAWPIKSHRLIIQTQTIDYQKPMCTHQYLYFRSHHLISHKTGVLRTLVNTLLPTEKDQNKEDLPTEQQ